MSKKTLTLDTPIKVDGEFVKTFSHDALKISADQFLQAAAKSAAMERNKTASIKLRENDYALHFYLGCYAIICENPGVAVEDLERVSGYDVLNIADIGWLFIVRRSGETSEENNSDERSEDTPGTSTQASKKSEE